MAHLTGHNLKGHYFYTLNRSAETIVRKMLLSLSNLKEQGFLQETSSLALINPWAKKANQPIQTFPDYKHPLNNTNIPRIQYEI